MDGAGKMAAIDALTFTRLSRVASEENRATRIAAAAAAQTTARSFAEMEALRRFFSRGATYSLGSGSPLSSERNSGTEFFE
jgi:hypothetical protein